MPPADNSAPLSDTDMLSQEALALLRSKDQISSSRQWTHYNIWNTVYMKHILLKDAKSVAIPTSLITRSTLLFLHFSPQTARILIDKFHALKSSRIENTSLLSLVITYIWKIEEDAWRETDDWRKVMNKIGLSKTFQDRVMDPEFKYWRYCTTAKEAIIWMMKMRCEFLLALDNMILHPWEPHGGGACYLDAKGRLNCLPSTEFYFTPSQKAGFQLRLPSPAAIWEVKDVAAAKVEGWKLFLYRREYSRIQSNV